VNSFLSVRWSRNHGTYKLDVYSGLMGFDFWAFPTKRGKELGRSFMAFGRHPRG
jgi:hypothetical protein